MVSPAVVEYTTAGSGHFDITNDSLRPLFLTLEAKSFTIDDTGKGHFTTLRPDIQLELSATSLRVPPKQKRSIFYRASAATYPAWFSIYANFAGLPQHNGMNVQLELPHTVYLRSKDPVQRSDVHFEMLSVSANEVHGVMRNQGSNVTRVLSLEATSAHGKRSETGGFPLLPGGERKFVIPIENREVPDKVRARFASFSVEQSVR